MKTFTLIPWPGGKSRLAPPERSLPSSQRPPATPATALRLRQRTDAPLGATRQRAAFAALAAGSAAISGTLMVNAQPLCLGANADASNSLNGNLDAARITKAHARYVAAFTPLNQAYPEG